MSGDAPDDAQKTEEPTQKRLDDAAKKGDKPRSQEIKHLFMLGGLGIVVGALGVNTSARLTPKLGGLFVHAHEIGSDYASLHAVMADMILAVGMALAPIMIALVIAALMGNLIQGKPTVSSEKIKPKLEKLSVLKGAKRLFSAQSFIEFAKSVFKFLLIGSLAVLIILPEIRSLDQSISMPPAEVMGLVHALTMKLIIGVISAMVVIAGLDYAFQRQQFMKRQRMTKQEIKDEYKQADGDPHVKARLRQIRMERSRQRISQAVPTADVIVTNPTHYAIALKYDHGNMAVPQVVAKGVDHLAAKIREIAKDHDIPLVENPPLARALYATVDIDEDVPPEHYEAVAKVISYIMKLKKR
ncbi:MAG: flagellar biosynthesis protein FlhB [Pseudomonadota bacterium]